MDDQFLAVEVENAKGKDKHREDFQKFKMESLEKFLKQNKD